MVWWEIHNNLFFEEQQEKVQSYLWQQQWWSIHGKNPSRQGVYFNIHKEGMHYHNTKNCHITLVQTVSKNEAGYSKRQTKNAKLTRELYSKVAPPPRSISRA